MSELFTCLRSNKSPYYSYEAHGCEGKVGTGPTPTHLPFLAAYREANHVYQVSVRFTAKGCELAANARFVEELKKIMESLISDLTCGVKGPSYRCHSLEAPHRGSPSELFITFQGNGSRRSRMGSGIEHHERTPGTPTRPPTPPHEAVPLRSRCAFPSQPTDGATTQRERSERAEQSGAPKPRSPPGSAARRSGGAEGQPGAAPRPPAQLPIAAPDPGGAEQSPYGAAPPLSRESFSKINTHRKERTFPKAPPGGDGEEEKPPSFTREAEHRPWGEQRGGSQRSPHEHTSLCPRSEPLCSGMGGSLQPPPSGL